MAYDINLADRIRERFSELKNVEEKEMMGGLTFMLNDKMCVGVIKDEMMCRMNPEIHETSIERTGCRTMDFTNRPMKGYVMIEPAVMKSKSDFDYWIGLALKFNEIAKSSKRTKKNAGKK
jgi:TfoX/Sxy family transcriptional regulator of competence genes